MDAALGIAILEHPRQAWDRAADGHIAVGAPDDIFRLLAEAPLLRAAVALIPDSGAAPDPARPLEGVGGCWELPPVNEHTNRRAALTYLSCLIQPLCRPAGPGTLVLGVPIERGRRVLAHAGILPGSGFVFLRLGAPTGRIGRIGDDSVKGVGGKGPQHLQGITLEDAPFLIIAHAHASPSFSFDFRGAETAPSPHIR